MVEARQASGDNRGDGEGAYRVRIDGNWYFVTKQQFDAALQNTGLALECAGPID